LNETLSAEYAERALELPEGKWRDRFRFALDTSLEVLGPHRTMLVALVPVLVGEAAPRRAQFYRFPSSVLDLNSCVSQELASTSST